MSDTREIHIHIHLEGLAELVNDETPAPAQVVRVPRQRKAGSSKKGEPAPADIRKWANEVGMTVPKTGRPNRELVAAYKSAHGLS